MASLPNLLRLCKERLAANRRFLEVADPATPEHAAMVDRQKSVFGTALTAMPPLPEHLALELCESVAAVGWPDYTEQVQAIMDRIVPPAEIRLFGPRGNGRTHLQDYTFMENHVPERIWKARSDDFTAHLCEWLCVDMGLQNANETTVQKAVALSVLAIHGTRPTPTSTSWTQMRMMTDTVKKYMRHYRYQQPAEWVDRLPSNQFSFQELFPAQWTQSQARGNNEAVTCPHSATDVQSMLRFVPMRASMKRMLESHGSVATRGSSYLGSGDPLGNMYPGSGAPLGNSLEANPCGQPQEFMRMFAELLGGRGFRGPGDGGGDIALEFPPPRRDAALAFPPPRQQLQVVMNWLMR